MARFFLLAGILLAFLSVALGAFATHSLRGRLSAYYLEVFNTGVHYQGFHALALIMVAGFLYFRPEFARLRYACFAFFFGVIVFSGSLYILSTTGVKWLGAITPIGGVCFLTGWIIVLVAAASLPANPRS